MTEFRLADRMARLGTESAFEVLARAKAMEAAGLKMIHLEIGEPDFPTAEHIVEAAVAALRAGHTHYVPAPGIPPLREAVAAFLERTGRLKTTPDPGRQADHVLHHPRPGQRGRRGALPGPRLPDVRIDHLVCGGGARAGPVAR